jgi:hypothetical protein
MIQDAQIQFITNVQVANCVAEFCIPDEYAFLNNKRICCFMLVLGEFKEVQFTDEYIEANWRNFIITSSSTPNQDDDAVLEKEYGDYLYIKHFC